MISRHIIVAGLVQGVGFRDALTERAAELGLTGWVRNRRDGTVEALLQGEPQAVEAAIEWARSGPRAARVAGVEVRPPDAGFDRPYARFERWPSI